MDSMLLQFTIIHTDGFLWEPLYPLSIYYIGETALALNSLHFPKKNSLGPEFSSFPQEKQPWPWSMFISSIATVHVTGSDLVHGYFMLCYD